jgi:hypothetical protein
MNRLAGSWKCDVNSLREALIADIHSSHDSDFRETLTLLGYNSEDFETIANTMIESVMEKEVSPLQETVDFILKSFP